MAVIKKDEMLELEILRHVEQTPLLNNRLAALKLKCSVKLAHKVLTKMVDRGLLHVKKLHSRRWDYFLTPAGLSEKARLTCEFLQFSMEFYHEARKASSKLCRELARSGKKKVAFVGTGELAEIAYLGVKEWELELIAVYAASGELLGHKTQALSGLADSPADALIMCYYDSAMPLSKGYLPPEFERLPQMHWIF